MHILIVEDHPRMQEIVRRILEKLGFHDITLCEDIAPALSELTRRETDLVICDYHLPHRTGDILHRAMRQDPALQDIPFIMITADPDLLPVIRCAREGVYLLNKPFSPVDLLAILQELFGADLQRARA